MVIIRVAMRREPLQQLNLVQGLVKEVFVILDDLVFNGCTTVVQRPSNGRANGGANSQLLARTICCNIGAHKLYVAQSLEYSTVT
jgi:hypothetical protein